MAATTNRRFTELYRNSAVYETKQAAITGLYDHALINSLKDGEPVLARYMAYFAWNETTKQYVVSNGVLNAATFTRILSNETSATSTKEYIVGDFINVTANGETKSYKCTAIPSGETSVAVPVNTQFEGSDYFEIVDGTDWQNFPQYIKTIRVVMAVATVFEDNSNNPLFKKIPPKGRLTIFEEDDVIREMINKASISSPDGTINISDVVSGKEITVNLGTSLIKNTVTSSADFGKIDVNFDGETIIQDSTTNALKVNHGDTLVESTTSGEEGKLDVRTGDTIKVSAGGTGNPDAGTLDVKTGSSLTVSAGGQGNPELGTIDVNIDNQSIKQYASTHATLPNKLYVNVDNVSGLKLDNTNGIQVKLGEALAFRSGDSTAANNGKIDVQYDDNTISLNGSNQLVTNFHSGTGSGSTTMERKSHTSGADTVYDGWGVKHGTTITEDTNGIHVNIDDVSIKQITSGNDANKLYVKHDSTIVTDSTDGLGVNIDNISIQQIASGDNADKLYVKHDTTIVTDSSNGLGVNIDNKSIKQIASGDDVNKLYVNIDDFTIKQYTSGNDIDKLYVNIDNDTLVTDANGVISVNTATTNLYGENAIEITDHETDNEVDGKTVKLNIDTTASTGDPNVLSQSDSGLKVNLDLRLLTSDELATLSDSNVKEAYKLVGNAGDTETQIGSVIKIYKDSSLYSVYLGHTDDTITSATDPTVISGTGSEALCFIYYKADGTYELVAVNLEAFLQETEFKDGLNVNSNTHEVSVKVWNGIELYENASGQNKSLQAKIGNGINFGTGTDGEKPIIARIGNGIEFGSGTDGQKPIITRIGDGINFGTGTDGEKPIVVRIGNGLQFNSSATSGQKPIEVRLGGGLEYNTSETDGQRSIKTKVGTGIGIDSTTNALYVNYGTIGAANQPVYWDSTNHTPVAITHTIDADVPSDAVFTDTLYYSGNEITIDSTNNHINHDAKLGTTFTGTTAATTISGFGGSGTFKVPVFNINEYGHVTSASEVEMAITMPENKITTYTAPTYSQGHLSNDWVTAYTNNAIVVNTDTFDSGINKLDNKIQVLADELSNAEAVFSQAIEDETRYFAKSTTATAASGTVALTATIVENRAYNLYNGTKVDVYFQNDQSVSSATLAISGANGASAAKYLVYNDQLFNADLIEAGTTLALVYDAATITIGGVQYAGVYRVVGGVGSGSGSGSTNGITDINAGSGINVTKNYTEVTINSSATPYSSTWFKDSDGSAVITPETNTVYRVITPGNYYNMAYTWDSTNSKYVLSTDIKETVAVKLAANMIPEGSTSGSATEISGLGTLLKFTSSGELAMENTWDCGTY